MKRCIVMMLLSVVVGAAAQVWKIDNITMNGNKVEGRMKFPTFSAATAVLPLPSAPLAP